MMKEMLGDVQKIYENELNEKRINNQLIVLQEGSKSKQYQPLLTRTKCSKCLQTITTINVIN